MTTSGEQPYAPPPPPGQQPQSGQSQQAPPPSGYQPPGQQQPYGAPDPYAAQQPYGQHPYNGQDPYGQNTAPSPGKGLAIASLVLGILGILTFWFGGLGGLIGLVGLVLGIVGLVKIRKARRESPALAVVGVVIAGLEVPHLHVHVWPSNSLDDFDLERVDNNPDPQEMDAAAEKIRAGLRVAGHAECVPED